MSTDPIPVVGIVEATPLLDRPSLLEQLAVSPDDIGHREDPV